MTNIRADQLEEAARQLLAETAHRGTLVRFAAALKAGEWRERARQLRAGTMTSPNITIGRKAG